MTHTILSGGLVIEYPEDHAPWCPDIPAEIVEKKMVPRVMRAEMGHRANLHMNARLPGVIRDQTMADVMTPVGQVTVHVEGMKAERCWYPLLIELAMDLAWLKFCNVTMLPRGGRLQ